MFRHESLRPLSRQHHSGLALVVMASRGMEQRGDRAVESWCARVVERFDAELAGHFAAEEKILFPAAREFAGDEPVDALIAEHRRMEEQVGALRQSSRHEVLEDFLELLRSHIRKEENELFQLLQERMPAEALSALAAPLGEMVIEVCLDIGGEET
jgi:hemerythrin-like domain-containing protein